MPGRDGYAAPLQRRGFCAGKDAFAAPCPAGTWSNVTSGHKNDCRPCDAGPSCRAGSTAPQKCAAGTYSANRIDEPCAGFQQGRDEVRRRARLLLPRGLEQRHRAPPAPTVGTAAGRRVQGPRYLHSKPRPRATCPVDADGKPIDAFYCPGWEATPSSAARTAAPRADGPAARDRDGGGTRARRRASTLVQETNAKAKAGGGRRRGGGGCDPPKWWRRSASSSFSTRRPVTSTRKSSAACSRRKPASMSRRSRCASSRAAWWRR